KAYPVYDEDYRTNVDALRAWREANVPNAHTIGRNSMQRDNNQDHSMYTALRTHQHLDSAHHTLWKIYVEEEDHEEASTDTKPRGGSGTGRNAPIIPKAARQR